jgi:hypothetical protein
LHLLCDEREAVGAGESEFHRGAIWLGELATQKKPSKQSEGSAS